MSTRVLFVEDDIAIIESIRFAFSFYWPEAELIPAYLGQAGIDIACKGDIDVIVLDLGLPDMEGLEALTKLKQVCQSPIIVLSGRIDDDVTSSVLALGAHQCMGKPFKQKDLITCIKSHAIGGGKIR